MILHNLKQFITIETAWLENIGKSIQYRYLGINVSSILEFVCLNAKGAPVANYLVYHTR